MRKYEIRYEWRQDRRGNWKYKRAGRVATPEDSMIFERLTDLLSVAGLFVLVVLVVLKVGGVL